MFQRWRISGKFDKFKIFFTDFSFWSILKIYKDVRLKAPIFVYWKKKKNPIIFAVIKLSVSEGRLQKISFDLSGIRKLNCLKVRLIYEKLLRVSVMTLWGNNVYKVSKKKKNLLIQYWIFFFFLCKSLTDQVRCLMTWYKN